MSDLEIAEEILKQEDLNLVLVKQGEVLFKSDSSGIQGLLNAIDKFGKKTTGISVADRIVGRGAAFLCAYLGAKNVFGLVMSEGAKEVLEKNNIEFKGENIVENVQNREGNGICPFENLSRSIEDVEKAYREIKSLASDLMEE